MPRRDQGIAGAFARARAGDRRLATWMKRHHNELLRELGTGRVDWIAPLIAFAALGLTDETGSTNITRDTASRTWRRVRNDVALARVAEARTRLAPGELVAGVRLVAAAPVAVPPRILPAPLTPTAAPVAGTSAGAVEATERIRAVLAGMGASRVPLPSHPLRQHQLAPSRPAPDEDASS